MNGLYVINAGQDGVRVDSAAVWAGNFNGDVLVTGTIFKGACLFRIDHPLDPENKYLHHHSIESDEMANVYSGNVILDANGAGVVQLPGYFEAVNRDFRYQLTAVGSPGPNLYIAEEIANNNFRISGGQPGMKVSWQVTGIRHDPFANAHRIAAEVDKPVKERGKYLHPGAYGLPAEMGLHHEHHGHQGHDVHHKGHEHQVRDGHHEDNGRHHMTHAEAEAAGRDQRQG
jgi:hypothetical protein